MAESLGQMFASFTRSAWRLEARDTYDIPGDADRVAEYLRTGTLPPLTDDDRAWQRTIGDARDRGASMGRIRLVGHPITPYTRFEFAAYGPNSVAGEDIKVVDRAWLDVSWNQAPDVWVFDDRTAAVMHYADGGQWLGYEVVDGRPFASLRQTLEPYAVPFQHYTLTDVPVPRPADTIPVALPAEIAAAG